MRRAEELPLIATITAADGTDSRRIIPRGEHVPDVVAKITEAGGIARVTVSQQVPFYEWRAVK